MKPLVYPYFNAANQRTVADKYGDFYLRKGRHPRDTAAPINIEITLPRSGGIVARPIRLKRAIEYPWSGKPKPKRKFLSRGRWKKAILKAFHKFRCAMNFS